MKHLFCLVPLVVIVALTSNLSGGLVPDRKPLGGTDAAEPFINGIGMRFVWIRPGSFIMGSSVEEGRSDEAQHKVTLTKGFYMGVHLVTQEQWEEIMSNNPSYFKDEKNLPVETVSWDECQEFITKLRDKDKKQYRLPTEAEWEYCCRAAATTPFHFGETISTDQANTTAKPSLATARKAYGERRRLP